ncbi:MAG: trypsin-like peptidase domain-containing protein [Planctomycetes bacterium]|nr:trypsin-like peptidase domain-containing protein [Planctomycetota bacterium]MCB9903834.1 trypsin-like peptidase domain-containing protein [Planctomycetota bacterium]
MQASPTRVARRIVTTLALLLGGLTLPAAAVQAPVAAVIESASPAVVFVDVRFERVNSRGRNTGDSVRVERSSSGVLISSEGLVLTNAHLVKEVADNALEGEFWLEVTTQAGRKYSAMVVARDLRTDLALVQLSLDEGESLPAVPLGSSDQPAPGARLVTMSFPDGEHLYAFQGASALPSGEVTLLQNRLAPSEVLITDTRFHKMLDGGPLLDSRGHLAGLYNASHVYVPKKGDDDDDDGDEEGEGDGSEEPGDGSGEDQAAPPDEQGGGDTAQEPEDEAPEGDGDDIHDEIDPKKKVREAVVDYAVIVSTSAIRSSFQGRIGALQAKLDAPSGFQPELSVEAIAKVAPSVVSVWTRIGEEHPITPSGSDPHGQSVERELGSGVILDPNGLVVTSADLFRGKPKGLVSVRLSDGTLYDAEVLDIKRAKQLAMIRVQLPEGVQLPAAQLGDWNSAKSGEYVAVVGRPFGPTTTLSVGVVGNLSRGDGFFQVASWLHRGHWGGAVVDRDGDLIGIAVEEARGERQIAESSYLGFAAPLTNVISWFDEEWQANASGAVKASLRPATPEELAARRTAVSDVVDAAQSSLINVIFSQAEEVEVSDVFDPFAEDPEPKWEVLGGGSGVVIESSGLAISNWHVVESAIDRDGNELPNYRLTVTLPDGREYVAHPLSTSRDDDLALLQLDLGEGETVVPVPLGDSDETYLGQPVIAIGNALLLSDSVSAGIISCTSIDVMIQGRLREYEGMIMTDAAINGGNSGGALLDLNGRLIGINSAGRTGAGMAIPVNRAREVFSDKLLSAQRLRSTYIGIKLVDGADGPLVTEVDSFGPAERAGVKEDDVVVSLGGKPVTNEITWAKLRMGLAVDAPTTLVVRRGDEELALQVQPLAYANWHIQRQSGIELEELHYDTDFDVVREASVALHRAYTGMANAEPSTLMSGVLRVVRAQPIDVDHDLDLRPGDLFLGLSKLVYDDLKPSRELIKLDDLEILTDRFDPLATKDGTEVECWILRDGAVKTVKVFVRRPK